MNLSTGKSLGATPALHWLMGSAHVYECETRSVLRINQMGMENLIRTVVKVQVLDRMTEAGGYVVRVQVLHTEQSQQQGLHQLIAALNLVGDVLEIEVSRLGYAQRILNRRELLDKWPGVRAGLYQKFKDIPQTEVLLAGLDQQLVTPGALETAILPNGLYGLLFAGLLGRPFVFQPSELPESRILARFFGNQDLPLLVRKHAELPEGIANDYVRIVAISQLDDDAFDATSWRRLLRQITDTPTLDTTLYVTSNDAYELATAGGVLRTASQYLRVQVPQVYHNELTHRLTLQPAQL